MSLPFITKRQQLAIKMEGVPGVAETLSSSNIVPVVSNLQWVPQIQNNDRRPNRREMVAVESVIGGIFSEVSFSVDLKNHYASGVIPTMYDALFRGCGMRSSFVPGVLVTYAPKDFTSSAHETVTIEIREGGIDSAARVKKMYGACGTFSIDWSVGAPVRLNFRFVGLYMEPTDGTMWGTVGPGSKAESAVAALVTWAPGQEALRSFSLDIGNALTVAGNQNAIYGHSLAYITARFPTGKAQVEPRLIADFNLLSQIKANALANLSLTLVDSVDGNITLAAQDAQVVGLGEVDASGLRALDLDLRFHASSTAEAFTLTFY